MAAVDGSDRRQDIIISWWPAEWLMVKLALSPFTTHLSNWARNYADVIAAGSGGERLELAWSQSRITHAQGEAG
jgi:hypothetical protein